MTIPETKGRCAAPSVNGRLRGRGKHGHAGPQGANLPRGGTPSAGGDFWNIWDSGPVRFCLSEATSIFPIAYDNVQIPSQ